MFEGILFSRQLDSLTNGPCVLQYMGEIRHQKLLPC